MKVKSYQSILIVLTAMLLIYACKHEPIFPNIIIDDTDTTGGGNGTDPEIACNPDTVYFQNTILPLITSSCSYTGCHDAATHQDGIILTSYANIMSDGEVKPFDANDSKLYDVITNTNPQDRMPPPPANPLSSSQINLIYEWIMQGALNNYCTECDTLSVTYNGTIKPILVNSCNSCHSGTYPSGGIDLTTYSGVASTAADGSLVGSVTHASGYVAMPQNSNQLSFCKINQIKIWVNNGYPNN